MVAGPLLLVGRSFDRGADRRVGTMRNKRYPAATCIHPTTGIMRNRPSIRRQDHESDSPAPLHVAGENHLLHMLPRAEGERLKLMMERIKTKRGDPVFHRSKLITHIHFPLHGVISIVVEMEEGGTAEVGTVGNEGMAGLPVLFGADSTTNTAFYQVPGESMRMTTVAFRNEIASNPQFANVMRLHAQGFLTQVSQSAACNRLHAVEQRLCRWILMSHDRVGQNTVALTQEFLAQMLGVRRASVGIVASTLQKAGLIRYRRGIIDILNREGLEEGSCECYSIVRKEYERLLC